jgi:prevent-host-death family protein
MESGGSFETKTHLSQPLERVARGEEFTITKHGKPIAKLVPAVAETARRDVRQVIEEFIAYTEKQGRTIGGISVCEMIEEGRRF